MYVCTSNIYILNIYAPGLINLGFTTAHEIELCTYPKTKRIVILDYIETTYHCICNIFRYKQSFLTGLTVGKNLLFIVGLLIVHV